MGLREQNSFLENITTDHAHNPTQEVSLTFAAALFVQYSYLLSHRCSNLVVLFLRALAGSISARAAHTGAGC
jgi:hypothetical protein